MPWLPSFYVGAHTIGFAKCRQFTFRMIDGDPFLNSSLAQDIRQSCPQLSSNVFVPLDSSSPFQFDNSYYKGLQNNMGLLLTDQALFAHPETKDLVNQFASSSNDFFQSFVDSIIKMSAIGVLTGEDGEGEIRNVCTQINQNWETFFLQFWFDQFCCTLQYSIQWEHSKQCYGAGCELDLRSTVISTIKQRWCSANQNFMRQKIRSE